MDGIIRTVIGLIAGAIISHIQTNYGKIQINFLDPTYYFEKVKLSKDDKVVIVKENKGNDAHAFYFSSFIEIYNSSNSRKILRNIKLCIETDKESSYYDIYNSEGNLFKSLNIDTKSIATHEIGTIIQRKVDVEKLFKDKLLSVYLIYNKEKNKRKKIEVKNLN